ncbi:MAM domain-containing glycosylphosphatidylinositol anchor protein 1 isoform X2 [Patella vulgata]|uniref:MAM domain-containing glycosylphosphatidylinositol anchor protein 1 isoform X2 n=1 Tax=Patella vulgata TaxID=6465 RepID=UPI00217F6D64|nr:MAM domain-containing glycosylphosphatidylinositol anchor protein 1 isoform X2 [Patella vulgata]
MMVKMLNNLQHVFVLKILLVLVIQTNGFGPKHDRIPTPKILAGETNITVREGGTAVLPCSVQYLGTKQVVWRRVEEDEYLTVGKTTWKADEALRINHEYKDNEVTSWDLRIVKVRPDHAGVYECQITSTTEYLRHVVLNVVGPPIQEAGIIERSRNRYRHRHKPVKVTGKDYVELGHRIHLRCNATGGPHMPEDIDWFKNGDKIDSDKYQHIIMTKYHSIKHRALISELYIDRSSMSDTATYICRSSEDVIDSKHVTVLLAESPNVKRGTGSLHTLTDSASFCGSGKLFLMFLVTLSIWLPIT